MIDLPAQFSWPWLLAAFVLGYGLSGFITAAVAFDRFQRNLEREELNRRGSLHAQPEHLPEMLQTQA